jgi:hypothetical protein
MFVFGNISSVGAVIPPRPLSAGIELFPSLLALEIATAQRPAKDPRGHSPPHSRDERCQPLVGSAADSRRTAQAWDRYRPDHGCKIHGPEKAATVARLEDLPSQSCPRYRVDRPVCRPHDFVSAVVCASGPAAFAPRAFVVGRDGTRARSTAVTSTCDRSIIKQMIEYRRTFLSPHCPLRSTAPSKKAKSCGP